MKRQLSTAEAAQLLRVSTRTVNNLIYKGYLPATRLTDASPWRIEYDELRSYAESRGIKLAE